MNIDSVRASFKKDLETSNSIQALENLEIAYLGRNGKINELLQQIKTVAGDQKKQFGMDVNKLKTDVTRAIQIKRGDLLELEDAKESIDVTLPGTKYPKGSLHTTT